MYLDKRQTDQGPIIPLAVPLEGSTTRQPFQVGIPSLILWNVYCALHHGGPTAVKGVVDGAFLFAEFAEERDIPDPKSAAMSILERLFIVFIDAPLAVPASSPRGVDEEDVLQFTYILLRQRIITHQIAAEMAEGLLQRDRITDNAWRKKVDRWTKRKGLPVVGQRNPRRSQD